MLRNPRSNHASSEDDQASTDERSKVSDRVGEMQALRSAYVFAFGISAATHVTTFSILGARQLFPTLFSPLLNFSDVFLPPVSYSREHMKNMAIGIQNFFQYDQYVGSAAAFG